MAALLTTDATAVRVLSDGSTVGWVTLDSIRVILRRDEPGGGPPSGPGPEAA